MSAQVLLDLSSAVPTYEQIRRQIAALISLGELADGTRLPTVRALATDLGVAAGTVARAYKELEAAGFIVSRRRAGTVVTAVPAASGERGDLVQAVDGLLELSRREGVDHKTLLALIELRSARRGPGLRS